MTQAVETLVAEFKQKQTEINTAIAEHAKATKETSAEAKEALAKAMDGIKALEGMKSRLEDMEQKLAQGVQRGTEDIVTLGDSVVKAAEIKAFIDGKTNKAQIELKAALLTADSSGVPSSTLVQAERGNLVTGARRVLRLEDVIPSGTISSNSHEYPRELLFTNNAAMRADGAAAAESEVGFELVQRPVQEVTTFIPVSKNAINDSPFLKSYLDTTLKYMVDEKTERAIFAGSGVGLELFGLTSAGSFTAFTPTAGESIVDGINRAIEQVTLAHYAPDVIILHPSVWFAITREKTSTGEYVFGNPVNGMLTPMLFGIPVVVTTAIAATKVMVLNAAMAFRILNRETLTIEMAEQHADLFIKRCVALLATRRLVVCSQRPASAAYGNLKASA